MNVREQFIVLTSNDAAKKADAVILLEGDGVNRVHEACTLIKNGFSDTLVFSGGIDNPSYGSFIYDKCLPYILKEGIKESQIITELQSQNTREQAAFVIDIAERKAWKKMILVASHYHQYRAFLSFLKVLQERKLDRTIEIINVAAQLPWFEETPWGMRINLLSSEFEKIEQYKAHNHIASFESAIEYFKWKSGNANEA